MNSYELLENLNRRGPSVPTMSAIFFHDMTKMRCHVNFAELLSFVDAPLSSINAACTTLANIILKAHVLNLIDK